MIYFIIMLLAILFFVGFVFYDIGKKVKRHEKELSIAKSKSDTQRKYSRKRTPKVPTIKK